LGQYARLPYPAFLLQETPQSRNGEVLSRSLNVFLTLFLEGKALSALSLRVFLCSNTFQSSAHVLPSREPNYKERKDNNGGKSILLESFAAMLRLLTQTKNGVNLRVICRQNRACYWQLVTGTSAGDEPNSRTPFSVLQTSPPCQPQCEVEGSAHETNENILIELPSIRQLSQTEKGVLLFGGNVGCLASIAFLSPSKVC
jgi:hypothetical protein